MAYSQQEKRGGVAGSWTGAFSWDSAPQGLAMLGADLVAAYLSYHAVNALQFQGNRTPLSVGYTGAWMTFWMLARLYQQLYPGYGNSPEQELRQHVLTCGEAAVGQFAISFAIHSFASSRLGLGLVWVVLTLVSLLTRTLTRRLLIRLGRYGRPVSIIGAGKTGRLTTSYLLSHPEFGLRPVAIYDDDPALSGCQVAGIPVLGDLELAGNQPLTVHAIVSIPGARAERQSEIIRKMLEAYPITWTTPDLFGVPSQSLQPHVIGTHATLEVRNNLRSLQARLIKRSIDLAAALLGGVLISPFLLAIALAIRVDSQGPALYVATRLGRGGEPFRCYKFRTMHRDAEQRLEQVPEDPERRREYETFHKLKEDPRVTRVGRWLRRTSLDELPQILNVLLGSMSLVGPRPYLPSEQGKVGKQGGFILQVHPGITGLWQTSGRNQLSFSERVEMDSFYVSNWSIWLDLVILLRTARVVLTRRGAY